MDVIRLLLIFVSACLGICSNPALSREYATDSVIITPSSVNADISQQTITWVFVDSNDYLWVGTQQGLYKFNGSDVTKFDATSPPPYKISHSNISGISQDSQGRILAVTHSGEILRWNSREQGFIPLDLGRIGIPKGSTELIFAEKDFLVLKIANNVYAINSASGSSAKWLNEYFKASKNTEITSIKKVSTYTLFATSQSNIFEIHTDSKTIERLGFKYPGGNIVSISPISSHEIFIATSDNKIHRYNVDFGQITETTRIVAHNVTSITDILASNGNLWIGTNNGLILLNTINKELHQFTTEDSDLSHNYITRLFYNKLLWVGTYQGLDQVNISKIETYNNKNSGVYNDVLAFTEDSRRQIWIGTYNGLYIFDSTNRVHRPVKFNNLDLPDHRIMTLASIGEEIWIGLQEYGVYAVNTTNLQLRSIANSPSNQFSVTKILKGSEKSIWISTYNKGLYSLDASSNSIKRWLPSESSIIWVYESSDGNIFAASENELFVKYRTARSFLKIDTSFQTLNSKPTLYSISESRDHEIVLGTKDHGVYFFPSDSNLGSTLRLSKYCDCPELSKSTIYGMLFDDKNSLWVSTESGIFTISNDRNLTFRGSKRTGLQDDDFNFGSYYVSSDNYFYFGGVDGYNKFAPHELKQQERVPRVVISEVQISGESQIPDETIRTIDTLEISQSRQSIQISSSVVDFLDTSKNIYRYRLKNYDPNWIDAGTNNVATYSSLPPGDYEFQVVGANAAGIWNRDAARLKIRVNPNWWETPWAYASYVLLLLTFCWLALRWYRTHVLKEQALAFAGEMEDQAHRVQNELEEQREMQDGVIQAIHRQNRATLELIRSCSKVSNGSLSRPGSVLGHIACLEMLEDRYFYQADHLTANLHDFTDAVVNRLLPETPLKPGSITLINATRNAQVPAYSAAPLALIIYELLENSLCHAFSPTTIAGYLEIRLARSSRGNDAHNTFVLSVSDDGVGLPDAIDPGTSDTPGFATVRVLCGMLGATLSVEPSAGTRIVIRIPAQALESPML